jgi:cobalt/nickel transport system permease protein
LRELYAHRDSFIHQRSAKVKVLFTFAFIIFLNLTPHASWSAYLFVLAAIPLVFTGSDLQRTLVLPGGLRIAYSLSGLSRFASIGIKSWISVLVAALLAATTQFTDILKALAGLKVPKLFVAIVGLMWRYLFVITDEVRRMLRARSSRSAFALNGRRAGGSLAWRARVTGGMAGSLLLRSIERSDRVYAAMLSRGYNGVLPAQEVAPLSRQEWWILGLGILLLILFWGLAVFVGG